jgi:hypothetical protein
LSQRRLGEPDFGITGTPDFIRDRAGFIVVPGAVAGAYLRRSGRVARADRETPFTRSARLSSPMKSKRKPSCSGRQKTVATKSSEPFATPTLAQVDRVMKAAQGAGWTGRFAFDATLQMLAAGLSVAEAEAAFADAARVTQ